MPKVVSNLWFAEEAREAVEFYVSVIPDSRIGRTTILPAVTPSGPPGSVELIEFTLADQAFLAMKAGPLDSFNHSFSIAILVESQAEINRVWEAFLANGGTPEACGWLKDRWGLSWQIVPRMLSEMIADSNRERARRVTEVMLGMVKIDVADWRRRSTVDSRRWHIITMPGAWPRRARRHHVGNGPTRRAAQHRLLPLLAADCRFFQGSNHGRHCTPFSSFCHVAKCADTATALFSTTIRDSFVE